MSDIKSSYELALQRLKKDSPATSYSLTDSQKKRLAELDKIFAAKIAERELALNDQIRAAALRGEEELVKKLRDRLRADWQKLAEEKEEKKQAVRLSKS